MDLSDEAYSKVISDQHLVKIAKAHCRKWKLMPPSLGLEQAVANDIAKTSCDETEKIYNFFLEWKSKKGCDATYKALCEALQSIGCRADAEFVYNLVQPLKSSFEAISGTSETPTAAASTTDGK